MSVAVQMARHVPPIDWSGVPESFVGKASAVCRTAQECNDLVRWFGNADFCPFLPVLVLVPGAASPTAIVGQGYATAAELQDCAVVTWHQQTERLRKTGGLIDFDQARERAGLMRREEVDAAVRDALARRIAQHKASPVTDPFRQPAYPNPTERSVFGTKGDATWTTEIFGTLP